MQIGDIVAPTKEGVYLRSGAQAWRKAVVCSVEPFIMVSEDTTMRWSTHKAENFAVIDKATPEVLMECFKRLEPHEMPKVSHQGPITLQADDSTYTTVKHGSLIDAYYHGKKVGTIVEGSENSVIDLMNSLADAAMERAKEHFQCEMAKQIPMVIAAVKAVDRIQPKTKPKAFGEGTFLQRWFG